MRRSFTLWDGSVDSGVDPYASYATRFVNGQTGTDTPGATTYQTIQYGINDWLTTGGRRLCIWPGNYPIATNITFPVITGTVSNAARRVLSWVEGQARPRLLWAAGVPGAWNSGAAATGVHIYPNADGRNCDYLTIRGLEIDGQGETYCWGSAIYVNTSPNVVGLIVEYCDFYNFTSWDGGNNNGIIQLMGGGYPWPDVPTIIRFNKLRNSRFWAGSSVGSGYGQNFSLLGTYDYRNVEVYNNEFAQGFYGTYLKRASTGTDRWRFFNNYYHDIIGPAVNLSYSGGETAGWGDVEMYNCVCDGTSGLGSASAPRYGFGEGSSGLVVHHLTVIGAEKHALNAWDAPGSVHHSNLIANETQLRLLTSGSGGLAESDYNCYHNSANLYAFALQLYGAGERRYSTLAEWQAAHTNGATAFLSSNPDLNSITYANLSDVIENAAAKKFTVKGALIGAGKGGSNIGADWATVGPGW